MGTDQPDPPAAPAPATQVVRTAPRLVRYGFFAAVATAAFGDAFVSGDAEPVLLAAGLAVVGAVSITAAVHMLGGTMRVPPESKLALISPVAVILVALSAVVGSVVLALDAVLATGERSSLTFAGLAAAVALFVIGGVVQLLSWSDDWPDRWRPPYAHGEGPAERGDAG